MTQTAPNYDELLTQSGVPRHSALSECLAALSADVLAERQKLAEEELLEKGITFAVYGHDAGTEKIWPFDVVPRPIPAHEWQQIESGLKQRIKALNLFLDDVYNDGRILRDGVVPEALIRTAKTYRPECQGFRPPGGVWTHVTGTDLVRG